MSINPLSRVSHRDTSGASAKGRGSPSLEEWPEPQLSELGFADSLSNTDANEAIGKAAYPASPLTGSWNSASGATGSAATDVFEKLKAQKAVRQAAKRSGPNLSSLQNMHLPDLPTLDAIAEAPTELFLPVAAVGKKPRCVDGEAFEGSAGTSESANAEPLAAFNLGQTPPTTFRPMDISASAVQKGSVATSDTSQCHPQLLGAEPLGLTPDAPPVDRTPVGLAPVAAGISEPCLAQEPGEQDEQAESIAGLGFGPLTAPDEGGEDDFHLETPCVMEGSPPVLNPPTDESRPLEVMPEGLMEPPQPPEMPDSLQPPEPPLAPPLPMTVPGSLEMATGRSESLTGALGCPPSAPDLGSMEVPEPGSLSLESAPDLKSLSEDFAEAPGSDLSGWEAPPLFGLDNQPVSASSNGEPMADGLIDAPALDTGNGLIGAPALDTGDGLIGAPALDAGDALVNAPALDAGDALVNTPGFNTGDGLVDVPVLDAMPLSPGVSDSVDANAELLSNGVGLPELSGLAGPPAAPGHGTLLPCAVVAPSPPGEVLGGSAEVTADASTQAAPAELSLCVPDAPDESADTSQEAEPPLASESAPNEEGTRPEEKGGEKAAIPNFLNPNYSKTSLRALAKEAVSRNRTHSLVDEVAVPQEITGLDRLKAHKTVVASAAGIILAVTTGFLLLEQDTLSSVVGGDEVVAVAHAGIPAGGRVDSTSIEEAPLVSSDDLGVQQTIEKAMHEAMQAGAVRQTATDDAEDGLHMPLEAAQKQTGDIRDKAGHKGDPSTIGSADAADGDVVTKMVAAVPFSDEAEKRRLETMTLITKLSYEKGEGLFAVRNNDYPLGIRHLEAALPLAQKLEDAEARREITRSLGDAYRVQGELIMRDVIVRRQDCAQAKVYFKRSIQLGYGGGRNRDNLRSASRCTNRRAPSVRSHGTRRRHR